MFLFCVLINFFFFFVSFSFFRISPIIHSSQCACFNFLSVYDLSYFGINASLRLDRFRLCSVLFHIHHRLSIQLVWCLLRTQFFFSFIFFFSILILFLLKSFVFFFSFFYSCYVSVFAAYKFVNHLFFSFFNLFLLQIVSVKPAPFSSLTYNQCIRSHSL